jgi:hypothetical protein
LVLRISQGLPTDKERLEVWELGFIQRLVATGESCLLSRISRPNFAKSDDEEYIPAVLDIDTI